MRIKEILETASAVTGLVNPAIGSIIGLANMFLDDDKKLPETATGAQTLSAIDQLPPEVKNKILEKEIDLNIAQEQGWTERYTAQVKADGQTTRPAIALMMARVLSFEIMAFTVLCFWDRSVLDNQIAWTIFGILTATPATVIVNYFGNLRREHKQRQELHGVVSKTGITENIARILNAIKK